MNIALAQSKPVKGNIAFNLEAHKRYVDLAVSQQADLVVFPELSLTGYEPSLAKELATGLDDSRFDDLQQASNSGNISIGAGMPVRMGDDPAIGMIIFSRGRSRQVYTKQYLHEDEFPFFVAGKPTAIALEKENKLSLAICYELSVPAHSERAHKRGAEIYVASVAKSVSGVDRAWATLSNIANKYAMHVFMVNCVGYCDSFQCGGRSAAWDRQGEMIAQLDGEEEGMLIVDTITGATRIFTGKTMLSG